MRTKRIEIISQEGRGLTVTAICELNSRWLLDAFKNQSTFDFRAGYTLCALFKYYDENIKGGRKLFR